MGTGKIPKRSRSGGVTVPASEVKNAWHEFVDRVAREREEIVVTRYGKPIMKLSPVDEVDEVDGAPELFGFQAGTVTIHGDIVAPVGEAWDADA